MRLLLIDAGSSSVKFRVVDGERTLIDGQVDRVGDSARMVVHGEAYGVRAGTHAEAFARASELAAAVLHGYDPDAVVHRIVHGGDRDAPAILTQAALKELAQYIDRAPLHQLPQLDVSAHAARAYPRAIQIGCFDTAFHARMPAVARTYAIPRALARGYGISRTGYHGLAHEAMLVEAAALMGRRPYDLRLITLQLGNGVSACAIRDRHSVDTTMGFTPLEGVPMGTRSGSIDPAIIPFLCDRLQKTPHEVLRTLEHESGLLGLAGSSDVRDLLAREHSDPHAKLALDVYAYQIRKAIGGLWAALGRADAIVMAGGVSQSPVMRRRILYGLEGFGVALNPEALHGDAPVQIAAGSVPVFVVDGDELDVMRRQALRLLAK